MSNMILPHITTMDIQKIRYLLKPIKGVILDVDGTLTIPGKDSNYKISQV